MKRIGFKTINKNKLVRSTIAISSRMYPDDQPLSKIEKRLEKLRKEKWDMPELFKSIRNIGILQNLVVRPVTVELQSPVEVIPTEDGSEEIIYNEPIKATSTTGDSEYYQIICGNNRYEEVLNDSNVETVMCLVIECNDEEALQISTIENIVRVNPNPIQQGYAFKRLKDIYEEKFPDSKAGGTHAQQGWVEYFAELIGFSTDYIYARLKLLELAPKVRDGKLSTSVKHLIASKVKDEEKQEEVANFIQQNKLNYESAEEVVNLQMEKGLDLSATDIMKFKPPTTLLNEIRDCMGRFNKLISYDLFYLNDFQKMSLYTELREHQQFISNIMAKLDIATATNQKVESLNKWV
jgi:hypothetical protein